MILLFGIGYIRTDAEIKRTLCFDGRVERGFDVATEDAVEAIQEVANFNVSPSNTYCDVTDYYSVINNCNYAITYMDTSLVEF